MSAPSGINDSNAKAWVDLIEKQYREDLKKADSYQKTEEKGSKLANFQAMMKKGQHEWGNFQRQSAQKANDQKQHEAESNNLSDLSKRI